MNRYGPLLRPLGATLALVAIALVWGIWDEMHARGLMDGLSLRAGRNHFAVTLDFAPEGFHVTRLQAIGRVIEVRERTVYMMDVDTAAMRDIAANFWVREVATWPGR
jgi:hypothetical protein